MPKISVVVLGSFRKHLDGIMQTAQAFRSLGCEVLSPGVGRPINPGAEFVKLDTDGDKSEAALLAFVLGAIDRADLVYFYSPDGYLGAAAAAELGYCRAASKRVYFLAEPADSILRLYGGRAATPAEAVAEVGA